MKDRLPAELVQALMAELNAIEEAIAANQRAQLRALDDLYSASAFAELSSDGEALEQAAARLVEAIREHVEASNAAAVFGSRLVVLPAPVAEPAAPAEAPAAGTRPHSGCR